LAAAADLLKLPTILDQRTVEAAREALAAGIAQGSALLDASGVERINTVGVQLLLSAERSAREAGVAFAVTSPSKPFLDTLAALGLEPHFTQWMTR